MAGAEDFLDSGAPSKEGGKMSAESFLSAAPPGMKSRGINAPLIVDDPQYAASNLGNVRASLAVDTKTQIKRYAEQFGVPESHFGIIDGDIVRWVPEANAYAKVAPTIGGQGTVGGKIRAFMSQTATGVGPTLPAVAGTATGIGMGPTGASIPAAGGAAAVTDLARQALDKTLAGESPITTDYDWLNSAGHGAVNALGQAGGVSLNRMLTQNPLGIAAYDRTNAMDPALQAATQALYAEGQRRGINLSTGQATGLRSVMQTERQLGRYPETTDQLYQFSQNQRLNQVPGAFRAEVGQISPVGGREAQINAFREGAENVTQQALTQRSQQANQAYTHALEGYTDASGNQVTPILPNVRNPQVAELLQRPSMREAWGAARRLAAEEGRDLPEIYLPGGGVREIPDWRAWDYMKRGLDAVVEQHTNELGRVDAVGRAVANTRRSLLNHLDAINPDYAAARAQFGSASDAVNMILEGGTGILRDMDGPSRQSVVQRIFSGANLLPEEVSRMRGQFAFAGRINDWNAGLRAFLEGHLDRALKGTVTGGEPGNVPGKLYANLWANEPQRRVLEAAIGDPARVDSMNRLMQVLQAASRVLPEGSPTATDLGAQATGVGIGARIAGRAFSGSTYLNIGNELVEGVSALRAPAARQQLADYLLSPQGVRQLQQFRMLSPTSQRAIDAAAELLTNAGVVGAGNVTGLRKPADFPAPAAAMR